MRRMTNRFRRARGIIKGEQCMNERNKTGDRLTVAGLARTVAPASITRTDEQKQLLWASGKDRRSGVERCEKPRT